MNQGLKSVVGINRADVQPTEPEAGMPEPTPEKVDEILCALRRMFGISDISYKAVACYQVDLCSTPEGYRSTKPQIYEVHPGHLCVLPGKMTEAPCVADKVVTYVYNRIDAKRIAYRPCDL